VEDLRRIVLFIAMSLDGYIATKDEKLDWLFRVDGEGDNGYSEFFESVDTILLGKRTYDWIMKHEAGVFPYPGKDCYVFTRAELEDTDDVQFVGGNIVQFAEALKKEDGKNIWMVGGGDILHEFLKEKLIDDLIVTVAPAIIGKGIPLFKEGDYELDLVLKGTRQFNQFVELWYEVKK
jgi:dihydrofolate reductase